jgi:branched-chain amino acid transport system permease protein
VDYFLHILILIGIYVVLAVSLDLLAGETGLLSIAHAAFYGVGAYSSAILTVYFDAPFILGLFAGSLISLLLSLIVSLPSLRLHDDYFVMATFAFQMISFSILNNWVQLTRGPLGIPNIPQPALPSLVAPSRLGFLILVAGFATLAVISVRLISTSPFGRVLRAIREDEVFAQAMGKNTVSFKIIAFAVSAVFAAAAGSIYAHYISYVDPSSFTVMESVLIISMVIIGGAGSRWGPVVGAAVLVTLPEVLRLVGFPSAFAANLRQLIYGALLVVMMLLRPRGLMGKYSFGR